MNDGSSRSGGPGAASPAAVINPAYNFFAKQGTDYTFTNSYSLTFAPSSVITEHAITFEVPKLSPGNCIMVGDLYLALQLRLVDKYGIVPETGKKVAPINAFPETCFRGIRVYANETEIASSENSGYPLLAYTDMVLHSNKDARHGMLQMQGFYEDTPNLFQNMDNPASGFVRRMALFTDIQTGAFHMEPQPFYSKLRTNLGSLPLISGVGLRIELQRADPAFYMMSPDSDAAAKGYKLEISSASLIVPIKTLNSGLSLDLEKRLLEHGPLTYPVKRVEVKRISIPASLQGFSTDSLTTSSINPDQLLLFFVEESKWAGSYQANPLEFVNQLRDSENNQIRIERSCLTVNGANLESDPMDSPDQVLMAAYKNLFKNLLMLEGKESNGMEYNFFIGGYFMSLYDLTKDSRAEDGRARHPVKEGLLRYEVKFSQPLSAALNLFVLAQYHASFNIDKNRNIQYNFVS